MNRSEYTHPCVSNSRNDSHEDECSVHASGPPGVSLCVFRLAPTGHRSLYRHRKHRGEPGHTHGTHGRAHTSTWMTDHSYTQKNPPIQTFYRYHDRLTGTVPLVPVGTVPVVIFSPMVSRTDSRHHSCDTGGPRHRRRQRTLECGPAGPAQQHGRPCSEASVIRTNINTTQKSQFKVRQVSSC